MHIFKSFLLITWIMLPDYYIWWRYFAVLRAHTWCTGRLRSHSRRVEQLSTLQRKDECNSSAFL